MHATHVRLQVQKRIIQNFDNVDFENDSYDDKEYSPSIEEEQVLLMEQNFSEKKENCQCGYSASEGPQEFKCDSCAK